jgi:hypothetical protein
MERGWQSPRKCKCQVAQNHQGMKRYQAPHQVYKCQEMPSFVIGNTFHG